MVSFLGQSATAKVFETAGINMDTIMMAIKLADLDGDNNVSYGEFIQAMHTLHDATQKQDMWLLQLKNNLGPALLYPNSNRPRRN